MTITSSGGATPDLKTDSVAGPIKALTNAPTTGYGSIAAGALTQANARTLWQANGSGTSPLPYARCQLTQRSGDPAATWAVDSNVSTGIPTIVVTAPSTAGTAYLDVYIPGQIGA